MALDDADKLDMTFEDHLRVPDKMTALTQLTKMSIRVSQPLAHTFDVDWTYQLTTLRCLKLGFKSEIARPITIGENLSRLAGLTTLLFSGNHRGTSAVFTLNVDWMKLKQIERIVLSCMTLVLSHAPRHAFFGLVMRRTLRVISFDHVEPGDSVSNQHLVLTQCGVVATRLKAQVLVDGMNISKHVLVAQLGINGRQSVAHLLFFFFGRQKTVSV